jgi:hypothetical protein
MRAAVGSLLCSASATSFADQTILQSIVELRYHGPTDSVYVIGVDRWGASGCNAFYGYVASSMPGREKLLAVILAAQAAGKRVMFTGTCVSGSPDYFSIEQAIVRD